MTRKEQLFNQVLELRNQYAELKGYQTTDLATFKGSYSYSYDLKKAKLSELQKEVKSLEISIEIENTKKALEARKSKFYATEEGKAFKSEIEIKIADIDVKTCELGFKVQEDITNILHEVVGEHWKVSTLNSRSCELQVIDEKGKSIFGQSVSIFYDEQDSAFTMNVGTTGSFDPLLMLVGDRARFYVDFGKLLANTEASDKICDILFDFSRKFTAYRVDTIELRRKLENPFID